MTIGRRYYYAAAIFIASLLCVSHITLDYPTHGYKPTSSMGNTWLNKNKRGKKAKDDKPEPARKARENDRADREKRTRARVPHRDEREPERRSERRGESRHARFGDDGVFEAVPRREPGRDYVSEHFVEGEPIKPIQRWR